MEELQKITLHQSLVKPSLMMGAEQELLIPLLSFSLIIWLSGKDFLSGVLAVLVFIIGKRILQHLATKDPYMMRISRRSFKYKDLYLATEREE